MSAIRVLIVDGQALWRESLSTMLAGQEDFLVVGDAGDAVTAGKLAAVAQPTVIVTDLRLPDRRGAELLASLQAAQPAARLVVLTAADDEEAVAAAVSAGAQGYVLKHRPSGDLIQAIRTVAAGGVAFDPAVIPILWRRFQQLARQSQADETETLSLLEREILTLIVAGKRTRQIAEALDLSASAIEKTLADLRQKFRARNRAQLAAIAVKQGLVARD